MMKIIFVLVMFSISFACIFSPGTVSRLFAEANKHNPFVSSDSFFFENIYPNFRCGSLFRRMYNFMALGIDSHF